MVRNDLLMKEYSFVWRRWWSLLAILAFPVLDGADDRPVFTSGITLVHVAAQVRNTGGNPVSGPASRRFESRRVSCDTTSTQCGNTRV